MAINKTTAPKGGIQIINNQITLRSANRNSQNIDEWRRALQSAESVLQPRRVLLYDLYTSILADGRLRSLVEKRTMAITNADWEFVKDGQVIDEVNNMIDSPGFEDLLTEIMSSKYWGYAAAELFFKPNGEFDLQSLPKKHLRPAAGIVAFDQNGDEGINIRQGYYQNCVVEVGKPNDLGILLEAAQYVIYKRGAFGDWSQFAELFGMPFRKGTYAGYDANQRRELEAALEQMGSAGSAAMPEGTNIEFVENKSNSDGRVYDLLRQACNEELAILILGQTMTTTDGSSRAQGEVHKEVEESINKADKRFVRRWLNTRLIEVLIANGINTAGGYFQIKGEGEEKVTLREKLAMQLDIISRLGLPYDHDQFYDDYGLNKPADYQAQMEKKAAQHASISGSKTAHTPPASADKSAQEPPAQSAGESTPPPAEQLRFSTRRSLLERIKGFFLHAPVMIPGATETCCAALAINLVAPDANGLINRAWQARGKLYFDAETFWYTSAQLSKAFNQGWQLRPSTKLVDTGITYGQDDPNATRSYHENLFRFAGSKTLAQAQALNQLFRQCGSFAEFKQRAAKLVSDYDVNWLRTEYDTALSVGEAAATYKRLQGQKKLFPFWVYLTIADDRVRAAHRILHGCVFPADSAHWQKIYPPNGWNCRCYVAGRMKGEVTEAMLKSSEERAGQFYASEEWLKTKKTGFAVNRADSRQVFEENQMYIQTLQLDKNIGTLAAKHYCLEPSIALQKKVSDAECVNDPANPSQAYQRFIIENIPPSKEGNSNKQGTIVDCFGLPIQVKQKTIEKKTTGGYVEKARYAILYKVPEILEWPNEVWLQSKSKGLLDTYVYIKYYKNRTLCVVAENKDGVLVFKTWFELEPTREREYRSGLLIKKVLP